MFCESNHMDNNHSIQLLFLLSKDRLMYLRYINSIENAAATIINNNSMFKGEL